MKTAVYIGRFQPFHEGHIACVKKILETHDRVIIYIRKGKAKSAENPYSFEDRSARAHNELAEYGDRVSIQPLNDPGYDLTVFHGRNVGYGIKELKLGKEIENISASKIRDGNLDNR